MTDYLETPPPQMMSPAEAAKYLGVSVAWLAHARIAPGGEGPQFYRIGRSIRYRRGDLDAFLQARLVRR